MPLFVHLLRILWRNVIILGHNLLIFPVVLLVLWKPIGPSALLALPGFALLLLNAAWMVLVLAVICARFRDMVQVMQNVMQVLFYLTPLIWSADTLPDRVGAAFIQLNPFFHLISVVRAPLLGGLPAAHSWWLVTAMAVVGWAFALLFFGRYRRRVPYWL